MTPLAKGLIVGAAQMLLLAGIGAKFLWDRANYPRLWVETAFDSDGDGRLDRVHVDVVRPRQTANGLFAPRGFRSPVNSATGGRGSSPSSVAAEP